MSLPTYEQANTSVDALELVAPYIPIKLLPECCLVSKRWQRIFMPILWTEPTKAIFSNSESYGKRYVQFLNSMHNVSLETRTLVITLDFRPLIRPEKRTWEYGQRVEYLLDVRDSNGQPTSLLDALSGAFPSLRFFLADGLDCGKTPSLQNSTQQTMPTSSATQPHMESTDGNCSRKSDSVAAPRQPVRTSPDSSRPILFSASKSDLTIPQVMRSEYFHSLLYLDISYLRKPPSVRTLFSRDTFSYLRILKLRGLQLNDVDIKEVLRGFSTNLWSLDIRDNYLTDVTAGEIGLMALPRRNLVPECPQLIPSLLQENEDAWKVAVQQSWYQAAPPIYYQTEPQEIFAGHTKTQLRLDDADSIAREFQKYPNELQTYEPGDWEQISLTNVTGLTNLHISGNKITSSGVQRLLATNLRLQYFDAGTVRLDLLQPDQNQYLSYEVHQTSVFLSQGYLSDLESLTIHHSIVTGTPTALTNRHNPKIIERCEEAGAKENRLFNPHFNPGLRELTLTNVPRFSFGLVLDRLTSFLRRCATLEECCRPPVLSSKRAGPNMKPGLRVLQLEFERITESEALTSVSQDADADEFHLQSQKDFSFFAGENTVSEETDDFSFFAPRVANREIVRKKEQGLRDVIEELKAFRTSTKAAYEVEAHRVQDCWDVPAMDVTNHYHWNGTLKLLL